MWYDKYTKKLTHAEYPSRFDLEALIVSYMVATIFIGDVQHWTTSFLAKFTQFVGVKIWKFWVTSLYQCVGTIPAKEKGFRKCCREFDILQQMKFSILKGDQFKVTEMSRREEYRSLFKIRDFLYCHLDKS